MSMKAKVIMNPGWNSLLEAKMKTGLIGVALDIRTRAIALAPHQSGNLRGSGIVSNILGGFAIQFGSSKVPYARRRHFENKKNPQTLLYLTRATESVARGDLGKYFRGKV